MTVGGLACKIYYIVDLFYMPLSTRVYLPTPVGIGNPLSIGQPNPPFTDEQFLNFPYSIESRDYFAGSIRFLYLFSFGVSINPLADLGSSNRNPIRQRYGEATLQSLSGHIIQRYDLEYELQQIQHLGHPITLSRNEAARPKTYLLGSRPRLDISNANSLGFTIAGRFAPPALTYNGGGVIAGTTAATFTESGSIFQAPTGQPSIDIPPRSFKLDARDGDISFVEKVESGDYYINTPVNNLGDIWRPSRINLWMMPGVTGSLQIEVYKLTEQAEGNPRPPVYIPSTVFPLP